MAKPIRSLMTYKQYLRDINAVIIHLVLVWKKSVTATRVYCFKVSLQVLANTDCQAVLFH
jgi:hypothetical protein